MAGIVGGLVFLFLVTVATAMFICRKKSSRQESANNSGQAEAVRSNSRAPASSVLPDGRPKRREDLLYVNHTDTGEEYYGCLGNYNSRENSVDYDESTAGPSAVTVRTDGRPKRREDLLYVNYTDTGEEYYSRADETYHSSEDDDN